MKTKREIPDKYEECGISIYKFLKNNQHGYWAFKIVDFDTGDFCRDIGREVRKHFQPVSEARIQEIASHQAEIHCNAIQSYEYGNRKEYPNIKDCIISALRELWEVCDGR